MSVIAFSLFLSVFLVEGVLDLNNGRFDKISASGNNPNGQGIITSSGGYVWLVTTSDGKTYKYSVDTNAWTLTTAQLPLSNIYSDLDDSAGVLFAFGGTTGFGSFSKIYYLPTHTNGGWLQFVDDGLISARVAHTMTDMAGKMYIFGGWNSGIPQYYAEIGRAVQQECRDRSRMPSSA
eukprot:TRINITY_DN2888_c0_g1_i16.p1 TRINITY_DN2888_c0_g1~~TRINITY_DN2888_c0_g1_i16.p1  ORF type:complete len:178 (+),score=18.27 TRINITY_DN2888_c0_g1_i16:87-620(+)